ncbi:11-beta-hydroxysteroid dehydrogenase 1B isoform X2 [Morus notabilis]|uniref:11-beta-hydroxysteroid dehydrogenase 1B isoform X2 n=1 Tax=Morus notabilis TaxID=981085 RepID=UPI000CED179E|nr:11-beta-hydroxysteroid dehydrogenase 1B isoform X2 [Morus notabilis]
MVELIHKFLNLTAPTFTFFSLFLFYPPFLFFKFCQFLLSYVFSENIAGKVVLITGASSGIGEHLAYEYGSRGACLALVARREDRLRDVVEQARDIGSPDVLMIVADVSKVEDCKRIVDETMDHFGRLDHLVNNAGISSVSMFEEITNITAFRALMDTNFWGSVYTTRFAIPRLRNSRGKIVVLSSSASWLPTPRMSIYNASKAALLTMFETLRVELGSVVNITIVTPGFIESELTQGKFLDQEGKMIIDPDAQISAVPIRTVRACAKSIVKSTLRGQRYLTEPPWFKVSYIWKVFCPEVLEWGFRFFYLGRPGKSATEAPAKKIVDFTGAKNVPYPSTLQAPEDHDETAEDHDVTVEDHDETAEDQDKTD